MTGYAKYCGIFFLILWPQLTSEVLLHKSKSTHDRTYLDSKTCPRGKRSSYSQSNSFETVVPDLDEELTNCFEEPKLWCNIDTKYRSIDGRCNNLKWRTWGMANTSLFRLASAKYSDEICSLPSPEENLPSATQLAELIFRSKRSRKLKNITTFFSIFGEVVADDVSSLDLWSSDNDICCSDRTESQRFDELTCSCMLTEVPKENSNCTRKLRSKTTLHIQCPLYPVNQLSTESSVLDASFLYTSNPEILAQLRSKQNGKLKITMDKQRRPLPLFLNQSRNETSKYVSAVHSHPGTVIMSTLFLRLHNFLTDVLLWLNPTWEDDQLFEEARRTLIAMYQHIVYYEFVPVLIGYEYAKKYDLMPTSKKFQESYDPTINPATLNSFSTAAFRIFHYFFPASLSLINEHETVVKNINFTKFDDVDIMDADVLDQLIRGAVTQPLFSNQTIPDKTKLYIADIQRSRDHGLPSYNNFRELCQLRRILDFKELKNMMDSEDVNKLADLYADVDDIDLYVGGILEHAATDATVGPTFQCLIAEAFYRYKYGDRFFYEHKNIPATFTKEQLREIKKATAGLLICTSSNAIQKVQSNIFYTAFNLNPEISCGSIFRPDYSLWQEKPEAPKRYFNLK